MTIPSERNRAEGLDGFPADAGALVDAAERYRALHPGGGFHLEAPAGSGKTFLLTARYLHLLGIVSHPGQILAMTFTNKAAGEMQQRVLSWLTDSCDPQTPRNALEAEMLEYARKAMERHRQHREMIQSGGALRIQTFHSFCYNLVTQAPLDAGIAPGSTLLGEQDQTVFAREVIDETLTATMKRSPDDPYRKALQNRLLYLNNSWPQLTQELEELLGRRDVLKDLIQVMDQQRTADYVLLGIQDLIETELNFLEARFRNCRLGRSWNEFIGELARNGADAASRLPREIPSSTWRDLHGWQCVADVLLTKEGELKKRAGPTSGFYAGFTKSETFRLMQGLDDSTVKALKRVRQLPLSDAAMPDFESLWDLVLLLHAVTESYEARCRRQRVLDFCSLEMAALRLLDRVQPSELHLLLDQQIRHLLVDEFQDTNQQQWLLLQRLCAEWVPDEGRTLFVVGDPKQSIYGFRKAEVRLFLEAKQGLPLGPFHRLPLESLVLRTNFRSKSHLIDWCNDLFSQTVMASHKVDFDEAPFTPAACSPLAPMVSDPLPVELALFPAASDAETARRREAAWLAWNVANEVRGAGDQCPTIGILLFARTHLPIYLEALYQYGVSVQVAEGLKLLERPEAMYLWQLCRALVLPQDHLAWAAQLRSPWLLMDYEAILDVAREEPGPWVEKIRAFSMKNERAGSFWENLKQARRHLGHESLGDVVEEAWLAVGGAEITAALWGSRGLASCRRFFELARQAEVNEPIGTLDRLEQLLGNSYEPVDPETALSNVSIMTVHRAKGLEFDSVYLPFLDWNPMMRERHAQPPYLLERLPGMKDRYLLAARPDRRRGESDPIFKRLWEIRLERRWAEAKRLFYVAVTRARSKLSLSGVLPFEEGKGISWPAQAPIGWMNEHYIISEVEQVREWRPTVGGPADSGIYSEKCWEKGSTRFRLLVEPTPPLPPDSRKCNDDSPTNANPAPFDRERPRFRIKNPSSTETIGYETGQPGGRSGITDSREPHRLWGTLVHHILECWGKKKELPSLIAVRNFLGSRGVAESEATDLAEAALEEVRTCLLDPWLKNLYDVPEGDRRVEWALEGLHSPEALFAGVVDLAAFDGQQWRLVDFKTSRPAEGEDVDNFCRKEVAKHAPQIEAYRELVSKVEGVDKDAVSAGVYWTALRRWEPV
jgi:ATP-dependent exoDNAse (exonuclease V) beta subunit